MFKIESGIPIQEPKAGPRANSYPFAKMAVGDSFSAPIGIRKDIASAASKFQRRHPGIELSVLKTDDVTVRVWRIK